MPIYLPGTSGAVLDYATFVRRTRQTLTNKTSFAGTGDEQWGTEEAVQNDADLPALTGVTVYASVTGFVQDTTSGLTGSLIWKVQISLDGGSTWNSSPNHALREAAGGAASTLVPIAGQHQVTGTVTGDIQARVVASSSVGASAAYDLNNGVICMEVVVPFV